MKQTIKITNFLHLVVLLIIVLSLCGVPLQKARADEQLFRGVISGEGTYFEITNSDYLNITLESSEPIGVRLESAPKIIALVVRASGLAVASTTITIGGFSAGTAYYKYEDSYHNLTEFIADETGHYSYVQDITIPHVVFIQPIKSTKFIRDDATGGDCSSVGVWNLPQKTCTLRQNVSETIQIDSDSITLDGNNYTISGFHTGSGVYLNGRSNVTLKNLRIENFSYGVSVYNSNNNRIENNNFINNDNQAIVFSNSGTNTTTGNTVSLLIFSFSRHQGFVLYNSHGNVFQNNAIALNTRASASGHQGILLFSSNNNNFISNSVSDAYQGILLFDSNGNNFALSAVANTFQGMLLFNSSNNIVHDSIIRDSQNAGIKLFSPSSGNQVYHNNFIENQIQATVSDASTNILSLPKPIGGNYWSNYDEPNEGCNDINADKFCDLPYLLSGKQDDLPWVMQDGWKILPTLCFENCYSNVFFLPGLEASRLYKPDGNGGENKLWEPTSDADAESLFLNSDGTSVRNDVYTKDVIDEAYSAGPNIYKSFIAQMNDMKTDGTIADWKAVPYDWRLSLDDILNSGTKTGDQISYLTATSSPYIIQELRRLAKTSKTSKVTIVAHSNGGLVTKALTQKLGSEASALIDKIIFVAVPQVGTPQAIGALLHGYEQGLPKDWLSIFLSQTTARVLAENMQSAYNLLPSASYFSSVSTPVVTFLDTPVLADFRARYGSEIRSSAGLRNFIIDSWRLASSTPSDLTYPSVGNLALLTKAETVHSTLDTWAPPVGIQLYEIAGWGEDTLATVAYKKGNKTICKETLPAFPFTKTYCTYITTPTIIYDPIEVVDGDGTVVAPSALWTATATTTGKWWVNLREYDTFLNYGREHADILEVSELRTFIQNILVNPVATLPKFIYTTVPIAKVSDTRLSFILHSPLNLSATDNLGNITNSATSTIPGSRFTRYGEVQVLKVPKGTPVTLTLAGYAAGSFTLDMNEIDGLNKVIASTTFSGVPSATSTTATISFPNGTLQTATPLLVDYDNNGTNDFTIKPSVGSEVVFDTTPPEALISFSTTTQKLLIEGNDASGETTISTTATSSVITDLTGNTLGIIFSRSKQNGKEIKLDLQTLAYNGISTSTISKTTLQYEWSTDKQGNLKELNQKATIGTMKVEAHYDAKKNTTKIKKKLRDGDENETKEILQGMRVLKLITDRGVVNIDY